MQVGVLGGLGLGGDLLVWVVPGDGTSACAVDGTGTVAGGFADECGGGHCGFLAASSRVWWMLCVLGVGGADRVPYGRDGGGVLSLPPDVIASWDNFEEETVGWQAT